MSVKEPKEFDMVARRPFTLNGEADKKGQGFKAYLVGAFVKDGIELAEVKIGEHKPNAVPWDFVAFAEMGSKA